MTVLTAFDAVQPTSQSTASGFAILHGTLAPEGCVVRLGGFEADIFDGPARVFSTAGDALEAIAKGLIRDCDILIVRNDARYADILADTGVAAVTAALNASGLTKVTVITDGRTGSGASGAVIGNVAPSAAAGGPIAYINDDDIIHVDIAGRRIDVLADIDIRRGARRKKGTFNAADRYAAMIAAADQA